MAKTRASSGQPQFRADRYDAVPSGWFRACGKWGLKLPAISLGCWHNFGAAGTGASGFKDERDFHDNCRAMLRTAFDHGVTHFDLANNYGPPPGAAEERVGHILVDDFRAHRDELVISTKAGWEMWPGPYGDLGSRKYLIASLDQSLRRLKIDYVDIFYHHRPDPDTPIEETMSALDTAIRQGKVLYGGISSYSGEQTRKAIEACEKNGFFKPVIHQPSYSILDRWIEKDLLPVTSKIGMGTIGFCPLAQGKLTGKYLKGVPKNSRAASDSPFLGKDDVTGRELDRIRKLNDIASARGQTLAQMALAWVVRPGAATSALIGASTPEQVAENCAALKNAKFSSAELAKIDAIAKG